MIIDEILSDTKPNSDRTVWFLERLKESIVLKVQNVADYIFESPPTKWDVDSDFPSVAPPFANAWMEWSHLSNWGFESDPNMPARIHMGVFLASLDMFQIDQIDHPSINQLKELFPAARWVTSGFFFWRYLDGSLLCPPGITWGVSPDGKFMMHEGNILGIPNPLITSNPCEEMTENEKRFASGIGWFLPIPFMTLSFLHCKNVEMVKGPPHPPRLQEARRNRGKSPLVRWHTLTVEPVRRLLANANNGHGALTPKALHICRGHFKDFSKLGLFGKYRGTYWWPMHTRGSKDAGIVMKDYRVMAIK